MQDLSIESLYFGILEEEVKENNVVVLMARGITTRIAFQHQKQSKPQIQISSTIDFGFNQD